MLKILIYIYIIQKHFSATLLQISHNLTCGDTSECRCFQICCPTDSRRNSFMETADGCESTSSAAEEKKKTIRKGWDLHCVLWC